MPRLIIRIFSLLLALPACAHAANSVVNLSHYDLMRPDFVQMRNEGIVGIIHEATFPRFETDERYASRQQQAASAGLLWGAYHFADSSDPVRQADHFLNVVARSARRAGSTGAGGEVLLVLDFEKNTHYRGKTMSAAQAVQFIERVHSRTGKYPGIYSGEYRIRDVLNNPSVTAAQKRILQNCWLWIANYHYQPRVVAPWRGWDLWQYTGDGVCDLPRSAYPKRAGNIKNAERNIFRGSNESLRAFWQENGWRPGGE